MMAFPSREPIRHSQLRERLRISSSKNEKSSKPNRSSPNEYDVISLLNEVPAPCPIRVQERCRAMESRVRQYANTLGGASPKWARPAESVGRVQFLPAA